MTETLRPSTLGEILDRTAQLYRRNFWLFAGTAAMPMALAFVVAIPAVAVLAIPGIPGSGSLQNTVVTGLVATAIVALILPVYVAVYVFCIAGITQSALSAHRGEKLTIRAALKSVQPRFWTYFLFLFLEGIMAGVLPLMAAFAVIGPLVYLISRPGVGIAGGIGLGFLAFLAGAAAIGAIIWLVLSYAMGMAVCVAEKKTAWESLQRSYKLSQGTRGRIFVMFLLVAVLSMIVSSIGYIFILLIGAAAAAFGQGSTAAIVAMVVGFLLYALVSIGAQIVLQPVSWIALVLFYYDQRIRKEGFDIEWMMERAGMTQAPALAPAGQREAAEGAGLAASAAAPDTLEER
jgi:hypothetical protein